MACARVNEKVLSVDPPSIKMRTVGGYEGAFAVVVCRGYLDPPCVPVYPGVTNQASEWNSMSKQES